MGCDIHMYVEKLNPETKEWEFQDPPTIELYKRHDGTPVTADYWYWGRNYDLFAFLANVRNGSPFRPGDRWYNPQDAYDDRITPLFEMMGESELRGVPDDASPQYKKMTGDETCCSLYRESDYEKHIEGCDEISGWGCDGHSHQWYTLRELVNADYSQVSVERGWVTPTGFKEWQENGHPSSWSGMVSGGSIQHITPERMDDLIKRGEVDPTQGHLFPKDGGVSYYTKVEWTRELRSRMGPDWFAFLDRLVPMTLDDGSDVRCVFFFDN